MKMPMSMTGYTKNKGPVPQQLRNDTTHKKREEGGKKVEKE